MAETHAYLNRNMYESHGGAVAALRARRVPPTPVGPALPLRALDTLDQSLAFMDSMGRLQHANAAFLKEIAIATDGALLRGHVTQFAQAVWGLALVARLGDSVERLDTRTVLGARGQYRLLGTYIGADLFGAGACVMVALESPAPDPFDVERLRTCFKLTRKQAHVARLLAHGLRNDEIAQRLFVSPHTVRHHVEQIRLRVGGHTRAAIAERIRRGE